MLAAFQELKLNCIYTITELQHTMIKYIYFSFCFTLIFLRINLALFVSEFGFEGRWGFFVVIVLRVFLCGGGGCCE